MTIRDLIKKLKAFSLDTPVLVDWYEMGYTEVNVITKKIIRNANEDYAGDGIIGEHGESTYLNDDRDFEKGVEHVILSRYKE